MTKWAPFQADPIYLSAGFPDPGIGKPIAGKGPADVLFKETFVRIGAYELFV
jgi:hypothetical protein